MGLARKCPSRKNKRETGDAYTCKFTQHCGTKGYIAPELLGRQDYGVAVDLWAVGITMFEILFGYMPFYPPESAMTSVVKFEERYTSHVSNDVKDFIAQLLARDPKKRLTAKEALASPIFESV